MKIKTIIYFIVIFILLISIKTPDISLALENTAPFHQQEVFTFYYGGTVDLYANSTDKNVHLVYRNKNETEWVKIEMVNLKNQIFHAKLPTDSLVPPGVEYFFQSNSTTSKTYEIITEYNPDSDPKDTISIMSTNRLAYDLQYYNGTLPNGKRVTWNAMSPTNSTTATHSKVTSKMLEIRNIGTSPHTGVDLSSPRYTPIYAMENGTIEFVHDSTSGAAGRTIRIAHHASTSSGHPSISTSTDKKHDVYTLYKHLDSIAIKKDSSVKWNRGDVVKKGDLIAYSGNTGDDPQGVPYNYGYHLDFGICFYDTGGNQINLPVKYFLGHLSGWNSGNDLDFIQPPRFYHDDNYATMVEVIAYALGGSNPTSLELSVYMGTNSPPSSKYTMVKDSSNPQRYYLILANRGFDNRTVNLYIELKRTGFTGYVTRPLEYFNSPPSFYYRVPIATGIITPNVIDLDITNNENALE